jgi:translation initiation factor IF-2
MAEGSNLAAVIVEPVPANAGLYLPREGFLATYYYIANKVKDRKIPQLGLLDPTIKETYQGRADVKDTFRIPKVGTIAGCQVSDGLIKRDSEVRLLRDNVVVFKGKIASLRRFKDDASEVRNGMECGIAIANYSDIKVGDVIEAFVTERIAAEVIA